jgi:AraC family transcriptional regulator
MREANVLRARPATGGMYAEDAQGAMLQLRLSPSPSSITSPSASVGHLVQRAITFFDSNREAAWRCLRDASTLLDREPAVSHVAAPAPGVQLRPGGLAAWQAKRALDHIEANLGAKMAIEDMANLVTLSKSHFSRAFKCSLGSSPMAYVAARRVERAKLMMTSTRERLTDIALACGFADQSHLNRCFRRVLGTSPGLWRRMSHCEVGQAHTNMTVRYKINQSY